MAFSLSAVMASGIGGAAQAVGDMAQQGIDKQNKMDLMQQQSDLETAKMKAADDYKMQLANQARTNEATAMGAARTGIVNSQLGQKYAGSDAAVAAADAGQTSAPLTDDQKAAIQQSKDLDRQRLMDDPDTLKQAGAQTGYLNTMQLATLNQKQDHDQAYLMAKQNHDDTLNQIAAGHDDMRVMVAGMMAQAKQSGDKDALSSLNQYLERSQSEIRSTMAERKALEASMPSLKGAEAAQAKASMAEIDSRLGNLHKAYDQWSGVMGDKLADKTGVKIPKPGAAQAPAPAGDTTYTDPFSGQPTSLGGAPAPAGKVVQFGALK